MNKNTKIWLNYVLGGIVSVLLLWGIYTQVVKQLQQVDINTLWDTGPVYLLCIVLVLMPINIALEAWKWQLLANSAQPTTYRQAFTSYIAGIAFSIVTPNRIGEYPGRLMYMQRKSTTRLVAVAMMGSVAQMVAMFFYGFIGMLYYCVMYPGVVQYMLEATCFICIIILLIAYWRFDKWAPLVGKIKWLRRFHIYGKLMVKFSEDQQIEILLISLLRFAIYTFQYVLLLNWLKVQVPLFDGFCLSALFFWAIAVIPSIALVELGARGGLGIFLFGHFSPNTVGILTATFGIWCINLILPSIAGSLLLFKARLVR